MSRTIALAAILAFCLLALSGLTTFGLVGPDEPRYASIGREMANSGDWITPRLWGEPWFEKPALLFWLTGGAFALGLGTETAPRLPIALVSMGFLIFYYFWLRREFNPFVAAVSVCLLGTSAMWVGVSHVSVPDLPLAATFAASMLLLLPGVEGRPFPAKTAAALLALSVLAKGLVPLVLALPFLWFARLDWRKWLRPAPVLVFAAIALPWYIACSAQNGTRFLQVFFLEHQLGRFTSPALRHVQPFWFYVPVLAGALFPSILLFGFAFSRRVYHDRRRQFLFALSVFGFVFFSASTNKLPAYLLPLLPFLCVLAASGLDGARFSNGRSITGSVAGSLLLLPVFVVAAGLLPRALEGGLRNAFPVDLTTAGRVAAVIPLIVVALGAIVFLKREMALTLWFAVAFSGWFYVTYAAMPWVDRVASARSLWQDLPEPRRQFCVGPVNREWLYGLNYYAKSPLPTCVPGSPGRAIVPGPGGTGRPLVR